MNETEIRKNVVSQMIRKMIRAGINQAEIAEAVGCSRWALTLWLKKRHDPSPGNYAAIVKAYHRFAPDNLPKMDAIIRSLEEKGFDLEDELDCTKGSLINWRNNKTAPQSRYRARLVELYRCYV